MTVTFTGATSSAAGLGDIALSWDPSEGVADCVLIDNDIASDRGLATAIMLSLSLDRRAEPDDVPPSGDDRDRRGWWADEFLDVPGDRYGSRLWLLSRAKRTRDTAQRAEEYVREALAWMIEDRVASSIDVQVEMTEQALLISITPQRPGRDATTFRFSHIWEAME